MDFIKKEREKGEIPQILFFASKRKDTRDYATEIQKCLHEQMENGIGIESFVLDEIAYDLEKLEGSDTKTLRGLIDAVKKGLLSTMLGWDTM